MAPIPPGAVYATLLMNDAYLPGAMVLGHSLRDKGIKAKLVVLVTVDNVSSGTITELKTIYDDIVPVNSIHNKTPANLYIMQRPDLISTFTKIELWRQTQYSKIVYIDADVVALRAPNELLTLDTKFAAAPDVGWPDCFNSGVMVLAPNLGDYYSLLALAQRGVSFDGADQGLLNMHFRDWERISFAYNCTPSANYQYVPAYRHFQSSISMVHFIGQDKPWTLGRENSYNSGVYGELLGMWWSVYDRHYHSAKTQYYSGQFQERLKTVQDYVRGEETMYVPEYQNEASSQAPAPPPEIAVQPPSEGNIATAEQPLGDQPGQEEPALHQDFKPTDTVEVRRFSAPHVDWDPARGPPPSGSKPEASNFPTHTYEMSHDTKFFQPPSSYPEAPKDMWYQTPEKAAEEPKPKPIFPWEDRAPRATRVFPTPRAPSPPPVLIQPIAPVTTGDASEPTEIVPPSPVKSPDPWAGFQQRSNAWDDDPEIDKYVQAFNQSRRGPIQVLHHTPSTPSSSVKPTAQEDRRPSFKLTDFPTEVERPSLPVTPAPIRRPSFWGEERDESQLPAADGVPKQEDWNPIAKLEELQRRQSDVLNNTADPEPVDHPERLMPESDSREAAEKADQKATSPVKTPKMPKPILKEPKIGLIRDDPPTDESTIQTVKEAEASPLAQEASIEKPAATTPPSTTSQPTVAA